MNTRVIKITPEMAEGYLRNMINNRPASDKHVTFLAGAMKRGEWSVTGQPVIFTAGPNPRLLDGQHRMRAIIASGRTVEMLAVYGIDESLFVKMDQSRARSAADCLMVANRNVVARVVRLLHVEKCTGRGGLIYPHAYRPTNAQVLALVEEHPGIVEVASAMTGMSIVRQTLGGGIGAYCLYRMRADNASRANDFMTQLNSGEGMANRSPVLSLRNKLIDRSSGIGVFGDVTDTICCVALAWYMAIDGDSGTVTVAKARAAWGGWGTEL